MVKPTRTIAELYSAARSGERRALGRLLTKVERGGAEADEIDREAALEVDDDEADRTRAIAEQDEARLEAALDRKYFSFQN